MPLEKLLSGATKLMSHIAVGVVLNGPLCAVHKLSELSSLRAELLLSVSGTPQVVTLNVPNTRDRSCGYARDNHAIRAKQAAKASTQTITTSTCRATTASRGSIAVRPFAKRKARAWETLSQAAKAQIDNKMVMTSMTLVASITVQAFHSIGASCGVNRRRKRVSQIDYHRVF